MNETMEMIAEAAAEYAQEHIEELAMSSDSRKKFEPITMDALRSKCRRREFVVGRQLAWYAIRILCPEASLMDMARLFNIKQHTSVMHGLQRFDDDLDLSRSTALHFELFMNRLRAQIRQTHEHVETLGAVA